MSEYIVDFGDDAKSAVRMAMARQHGAELRGGIVRCVDCRWAKLDHSDHEYRDEYRCNMWITDVSADGYCWRGRRKEWIE